MKRISIFVLVSLLLLGLAVQAQAGGVVNTFMTDASGSMTERQPKKFDLSETPWYYVNLDDATAITGNWWWSGAPSIKYLFDSEVSGGDFTFYAQGQELWLSLTDWQPSLKQPGEWHIHDIEIDGTRVPSYATNFQVNNVVPEPISATLFLFGGATLALRAYRRKKAKI